MLLAARAADFDRTWPGVVQGVRRGPGKMFYARDVAVVRAVSETFGLAAVMLAKVESAEQVRRAHAVLSAEGIEFGGLVPMVETRKGMDRISGISFEELFRSGLMGLFESAGEFVHARDRGKTVKSEDHPMLNQSV